MQKIYNEGLIGLSSDDARSNMRVRVVCRQGQNAFSDIRLTNTSACSEKHLQVNATLKKHEKGKKELIITELRMRNMDFSPHCFFL